MADILRLCVFCGWNDDIKQILMFAQWDLRAQVRPKGPLHHLREKRAMFTEGKTLC